jgi:hypothetical protein
MNGFQSRISALAARFTSGHWGRIAPHILVARDFGHEEVFQLPMERTPEDLKLALPCELGDEAVFHEFLSKKPDAARMLSEMERQKLPNAARNNNTKAVRLMLEAGWPVDTPGEWERRRCTGLGLMAMRR